MQKRINRNGLTLYVAEGNWFNLKVIFSWLQFWLLCLVDHKLCLLADCFWSPKILLYLPQSVRQNSQPYLLHKLKMEGELKILNLLLKEDHSEFVSLCLCFLWVFLLALQELSWGNLHFSALPAYYLQIPRERRYFTLIESVISRGHQFCKGEMYSRPSSHFT